MPPSTTLTDKARQAAAEREQRRAEALRANLSRRKTQARERAEDETSPEQGIPDGKGPDDASV